MAADVNAIIKRYEGLEQQASVWRNTWEELATFTLPRKSNINTKRTPGSKQTEKLFDSTAVRANELLASSMQGTLTSSVVKWFKLTTRDPELLKQPDVAEWLDACADRLYRGFQQSNFGAELQEVYLDLGAFGTGALFMDEREGKLATFNGFRFQAIAVGGYVIGENAEGRVDVFYQKLRMARRAAFAKWGKRIGDTMLSKVQNAPDEIVEVLHGVYPREGVAGYNAKARRKPWASCYVALEGKHLIDESGFDEMPYLVPRWTKASGETYGRGPAFTALPDIRTVNEAIKLNLRAWAKAIDPPQMVLHDGVLGTIKLQPGTATTVYTLDAIKPFDFKARFDVTAIEVDRHQNQIRNCFYWDQLQLPGQQMYTATEVERRLELMQRVLGPTLGRLESELLQPIIERGFGMLLRAGLRSKWTDPAALPQPPAVILALLNDGRGEIDIEYLGPLARVQRASDVSAIERAIQVGAPILQIAPDAADVLRADASFRFILQRSGVPAELIASEDEIAEARAAKTAAREEAANQEKIAGLAESAGKAAPFMKAMQEGVMGAPQGATQ